MALVPLITRNWSGRTLRKIPTNWELTETWICTGYETIDLALTDLIAQHSSHPDNPDLKMDLERTVTSTKALGVYQVVVPYTFRGQYLTDLELPTVFSGSYETICVPVDRDLQGYPIVNSAGDPFDPPPTREETVFVLRMQRNVPAFSIGQGVAFSHATNSNSFSLPGAGSVDIGQALCRVFQPVTDWSFGDPFIRVEAVIAFRDGRNPWDFHPADRGRNGWYTAADVTRGRIVSSKGVDLGIDVRLDGTGKPIDTDHFMVAQDGYLDALGAPVENPTLPTNLVVDDTRSTEDQKILEWLVVKEADFSSLPF